MQSCVSRRNIRNLTFAIGGIPGMSVAGADVGSVGERPESKDEAMNCSIQGRLQPKEEKWRMRGRDAHLGTRRWFARLRGPHEHQTAWSSRQRPPLKPGNMDTSVPAAGSKAREERRQTKDGRQGARGSDVHLAMAKILCRCAAPEKNRATYFTEKYNLLQSAIKSLWRKRVRACVIFPSIYSTCRR